jgi:outer membrane protein TolC
MLPQFLITAGVGSTATQISDLLKAGTEFWSVGASLSQTLFAGGSLYHKKRASEAALDQAGAIYRATVLAALQNVADALHALASDAAVLQANARAAQAADSSLQIARRQLELGSVSYLSLIIAEQNYRQTQIALVGAQMNRLADTAALFQALGGPPIPGT